MRMVQRKLVDKLGIQADHVESKKGSSPSQNQDKKNKGAAQSKKTMEKSRAMQHLDFESLRSTPPLRSKDNHILKSGKPPSSDHHIKTRAATPQRQSPDGSPNYMKSTSSFDSRREHSQFGSQTQNVMIRESMSLVKSNNDRQSSGSVHKPVGIVARTSSLKVVRTLTKTPSFKPERASPKKYSPVSLCEDFDVLKPTCSSTLKDSKMTSFLELSSGATESEGTSAIKVCPYTYCSLNGHHHAPLPPLKSFLSAKRRMLKAQKVIKIGCLLPHRGKPSRESMVKIDAKQVILSEIPPTQGMDFDSRSITPLMHEKKTDSFIEIYTNNRDADTAKGKIAESPSSSAPGLVTDFKGNLEAEKDQNVEAVVKIHPFPKTQEYEILDCLTTQCNRDEESQQISPYGQSDSKASEMELKEGHHYEPILNDVSNLKLKATDICDGPNIESVSNPDDNTNNSYEEIVTSEVRVGFYDEKSVSSGVWSDDDGDFDLDGSYQNVDLEKLYFACSKQIQGKIYSTCDGNRESVETQVSENSNSCSIDEFQATGVEKSKVPEARTGENNGNCELVETRVKENSTSHPMEGFQAASVEKEKVPEANGEIPKMNFQRGCDEIRCTSDVEEFVFGLQGDEAAEQEHVGCLLDQDFIEQNQDETHKNYNASFNSMDNLEPDTTSESRSSDDVLNKSFLMKTEYEDADQEDHEEKIFTTDARDEMEEREPLAAESYDGIRTFDLLRETDQEKPTTDAKEGMERKEKLFAVQNSVGSQPVEFLHEFPECIAVNKDQSKQTDVTVISETNEYYADETVAYESNGVENLKYPKVDQDQLQTYELKSSKYSENQEHSGLAVSKATPIQNQEADTGEGENRTEPDAAETSIIAKASIFTQIRDHVSSANRTSKEEMTQIAKHLSWTTGSRNTVVELEDVRDFNPREPNYLPAEPGLEPEKVDLRHQLIDERKNSEEWMVDYALRQAVTKLAPKRRRKVSLLVEAFEKVLPTPKYESRSSQTSSAFVHARTIQTCR